MPFATHNGGSSRASSAVVVSEHERTNGWQCPWHYLQLVAWFFLVFFGVGHFALIVPCLNTEWRPAAYIIPSGFYLIHLVLHLMCLTIDPADPNIRGGARGKASWFDRTQHRHVIENNHCYICQVDVAPQSKHCSVCNKCVAEFDHHCKWLNNCIGGRNYRLFLGCVMSALALALVVFVICFYVFVIMFIQPDVILNNLGGEFRLFKVVPKEALVTFLSVHGLLLLLAIILLSHLLGFHFYLMWHRMTTYEFIVSGRNKQPQRKVDLESGERRPPQIIPLKNNRVNPTTSPAHTTSGTADISRTTAEVINEVEPRIHIPRPVPQLNAESHHNQNETRHPGYHNMSSSEESLHPTPTKSHTPEVVIKSPSPVRTKQNNERAVPPLGGMLTSSQHSEDRIYNDNNVTPRTVTSVKAEMTDDKDCSESEEEIFPVNTGGNQRHELRTYDGKVQSLPQQNYHELKQEPYEGRSRSPSPRLVSTSPGPSSSSEKMGKKLELQEGGKTTKKKKKRKSRSRSTSPEVNILPPVTVRRPLPLLPSLNEGE